MIHVFSVKSLKLFYTLLKAITSNVDLFQRAFENKVLTTFLLKINLCCFYI